MKKTIAVLFLITASLNSFSQSDSIRIYNATEYLNKKLGKEFANKYLEFGRIETRWVLTFYVKEHKCKEHKNTIAIFFDGLKVDEPDTKVDSTQIINCFHNRPNCKLLLDREEAINIANNAGLNLDKYKYTIVFQLMGGSKTNLKWVVSTTEYNSRGYGSGKNIDIDMKTGKYDGIGGWRSEP